LEGGTIDIRHHKIRWWNSARGEEGGKKKEEREEGKHLGPLSLYYSPKISSEHWTITIRLSTMEFKYMTGGMEGVIKISYVANTGKIRDVVNTDNDQVSH